jgi:hypothetical protein
MKNLSYKELKKKVRESDKKDFFKLLFVVYWITGIFGILFAFWVRFSTQVKDFFANK